jgi:glycosyltransferase involved in cell wall biosynthesis
MFSNQLLNNRYKTIKFINNPIYETDIEILADKTFINKTPFFSIVTPVYNQENIIIQNLKSILDNTTEKYYEIIYILDSCSDNTEQILINFINNININNPLLIKILILKSSIPLFETSADNLGFICSNGEYILEIQADMTMTEYGYNMKLLKPFTMNENIIGISGRCCHSFDQTIGIGKLGVDLIKPISLLDNIDKNAYYIGETCNRGPLLLNNSKLKELSYLDEVNYFLDDSDHDLFARAYFFKNWICGYVPIDFISPLENGSTRKPRDSKNEQYYKIKKDLTQNGINGFLKNNIFKKKRDIIKMYYTNSDIE